MSPPALQVIDGGKRAPAKADVNGILRELYERYGGAVYGRCLYLLKDRTRAEDAMQDVFARVLTHHASFREEASPLTWLMTIATHHFLNVLRSERAGWRRLFERQEKARPEGHGGQNVMELREMIRTLLSRFGGKGYQTVFRDFVPMLRERGIPDTTIESMLRDNPRRMLTMRTAA